MTVTKQFLTIPNVTCDNDDDNEHAPNVIGIFFPFFFLVLVHVVRTIRTFRVVSYAFDCFEIFNNNSS